MISTFLSENSHGPNFSAKFSYRPKENLVKEVQKYAKTHEGGDKYVDIPYVLATKETLEGYGELVTDYDEFPVQLMQWPPPGKRAVLGGTDAGFTGVFDF